MMGRQKTLVVPFDDDGAPYALKRDDVFGPGFLFTLSRIAGCFHFNDKGKCSIANVMYSSVFNLLVVVCYVYTLDDRVNHGSKFSDNRTLIETSIGFVIVGGNAIFSVLSSVVVYLYKGRFPLIMKNVNDFKLHTMNKVMASLILGVYLAMVLPSAEYKFWVEIPYHFVVFQHLLYIAQYVILTNRWNRYLMTVTKFVNRFDEKMMEGHARIIKAHRHLNDIYGLPILLNVILSFTITVENLFKFYFSLKAHQFDPRTIPPVLFYSILIFWVAATSDFTTTLANNFNTELFQVMNRDSKMRNDNTLRIYLLKKYTLDFSACGFFTVGYSFITSLIAAAVTYLVVLIQFTE